MKTAPDSIVSLLYVQLPEDQGQPDCAAWAHDQSSGRLVRRTFAWDVDSRGSFSNLRHEFRSFREGKRGEFDPMNGKLNAIGRGRFEGASFQS